MKSPICQINLTVTITPKPLSPFAFTSPSAMLTVNMLTQNVLQGNIFRVDGVNKLSNASDAFVPIIWFEDGIEEIDDEETISLLQSAVLKPALIQSILYPILFAVGIFVILLNISLLIRRHFNNESKNFEDLPMEARSSGY